MRAVGLKKSPGIGGGISLAGSRPHRSVGGLSKVPSRVSCMISSKRESVSELASTSSEGGMKESASEVLRRRDG